MNFENFMKSPAWESGDALKNLENIYKEIWHDSEYNRFGIGIESGDVVVDCGANIGMFSQYAVHMGAEKVIAYECGDEEFNYLQINTSATQNILPIQGFVSDTQNSIRKIILDNNLSHIDFLKIDIEGYEYELIINEEPEYLNKVNKIAIELHIFGMFQGLSENFEKSFKLIEKLSKCGFKITLEHIHKNTCLFMLYASK